MRNVPFFVGLTFFAACAPESQEVDALADYSVIGELPADADVDQIVAEMGDAEYRIVADPVTGDVAVVVRDSSPFARDANNDFSIVGAPTCLDCGSNPCVPGVTQRTIEFVVQHDSGWSAEEFITATAGASNFTGVTVNPVGKWAVPLASTQTLQYTGTVPTCNSFSYDFDIVGEQRVFVTSTASNGNLGGLAGADATCQTRATNAGLTGTYMAWLSATGTSAASRMPQQGSAYVLVNGNTVANTFADLTDAAIQRRIDRNESGAATAGANVWTGTTTTGASAAANCANWTVSTNQSTGSVGRTDRTNNGWTAYQNRACNVQARLYCVEQ